MNSIKDQYIYMPRIGNNYQHVVGAYTASGLPSCIGSVDSVRIACDRCLTMHKKMFKGKERFCLIAYEVVCNCRKFIQSVLVGHSGTRNYKQKYCDGIVGRRWLAELQVLDHQCCEWNP